MNRKPRAFLLLLPGIFLMVASFAGPVHAQVTQPSPAAAIIDDPLKALPASDLVGFVNLRRILTEVVPRVMAKDPATLAKMMTALEDVRKKTGINILSIDRVVMGARFFGTTTSDLKKEDVGLVIIVHGDFDANTFIAALKRETHGRVDETTYGGKVVYSEPAPAPPKKRADREIPAVAILDSNTLAVGDLPQVRATIDVVTGGTGGVDSALSGLAMRDPAALVGVAGNVPESLREALKNSGPKEETEKAIVDALVGITQIYSSTGTTPTGFSLIFGARFATTAQAQSIGDMLLGLRQQMGSQIPDPETRKLLEGIEVVSEGNEVQLKSEVKDETAQGFIASMIKDEKPNVIEVTKPAPAKAKQTTKSRRNRRRRRH